MIYYSACADIESTWYQNTGYPENLHGIQAMMTSSNGNIFLVTGHLCGDSPVTGEFPAQKSVTRSFDIFFDLRLNKRLSKQ